MTAKRLNEIVKNYYGYISYNPKLAEEYLEYGAPCTENEETIAWCFIDYLESQNLI